MAQTYGCRIRVRWVTVCLNCDLKGPEGIGRVFYCMQLGGSVVILHSFIKKTNTTPVADLKLARKRLKEVKNG
jgi:phage-related protein